jgi:transposase
MIQDGYASGMNKHKKHKYLEESGLLNQKPEAVQDLLFLEKPEFFDAADLLQVRYEMIRSHEVDQNSVVDICRRFGISRQTFYTLLKRFISEGSSGLMAKKVGPKGPSKLSPEIMAYIEESLKADTGIKAGVLLMEIKEKFGITFHRRTVEKALQRLRKKKNP